MPLLFAPNASTPIFQRPRATAIAWLCQASLQATIATGIVAGLAAPAIAQTSTTNTASASSASQDITYRIAPGSLTDVLNQFAQASGTVLSFDPALTAGIQSPGLNGRYSVQRGFEVLLLQTPLQAVQQPGGSFGLRRVNEYPTRSGAAAEGSAALPEVVVTANRFPAGLTEGSQSYTTSQAHVGGKMGESLREVPRSVSVITRQQLDDQRMLNMYDTLGQLPGVTLELGGGNSEEATFYSRGYRLDGIMVDGLSVSTREMGDARGGGSNSGMVKYDSVQLLRGPDGLFSGNGQPSGTLNLTRKRPTAQRAFNAALSAGSWRNYSAEADLSTPVTEDGRIRARGIVARNTSYHFFDSAQSRKGTYYGIVEAQLTPDTLVSAGASRDTNHGAPSEAPGFPRFSNGDPLPLPRSAGYPDWARRSYDTDNWFATLDQQLGQNWLLKAAYTETQVRNGYNEVSYYAGAVEPGQSISQGSYATQAEWSRKVRSFSANLSGDFELAGRKHELLLGADYNKAQQNSLIGGVASNAPIRVQPIDWANFDSATGLQRWSNVPSWDNLTRTQQQGVFGYARFEVQDNWKLILGGRYSRYQAWSTGWNAFADAYGGSCPSWATTCDGPVLSQFQNNRGIFTPYYALMWDFSPEWTAYVSMSRSFEDQSNYYTADHDPLSPTTGRSYELGFKGEHFGGQLNTNITFYRSTRNNYAVHIGDDDNFTPAGQYCCYSGDGKFLAQGVEFDVNGAITPQWQVNAGYTYDDNKTEYGSNNGQRYASYTPKHTFRLWSSYQLHGAAAGWRVGAGVQAQSSFFKSGTVRTWNPDTNLFNGPTEAYRFTEPGRAVWSLFAQYRINPNWSAALNVNNLFDKKYFQSVGSTTGGNYYGAPRNWMLTLRASF